MGMNSQIKQIFREFGEQPRFVSPTTDDESTLIVLLQRPIPRVTPLFIIMENTSKESMTITAKQSEDNGDADAFAAINMRHRGADVASIEIAPGGRVAFTIETTAQTEEYLRLDRNASRLQGKIWIGDAVQSLTELYETEV